MQKDKVMEMISQLPDEFDLEYLIERLIFIEKVEEGLKQAENGQGKSHEEFMEELKKW